MSRAKGHFTSHSLHLYITELVSRTVADYDYSRMISIFIFCLCCLTAGAKNLPYHFSGAVGRGSGTPFTSDPPNTGTGRITGVKVWELNNGYIRGLQIKHDYNWGELFGRNTDIEHEFILFEREVIVQVSGKYNPGNWIYLLTFGTNWGRTFTVGQASGISFNFFQDYPLQELVTVSGRFDNNGLTSIAAHWGILDLGYTGKNESDVAHH